MVFEFCLFLNYSTRETLLRIFIFLSLNTINLEWRNRNNSKIDDANGALILRIEYIFHAGSNSIVGLTRRRISITEDGPVCKNRPVSLCVLIAKYSEWDAFINKILDTRAIVLASFIIT